MTAITIVCNENISVGFQTAGVEAIGVSTPEDATRTLMQLAAEAAWGIVLVDSAILNLLAERDKERLQNSSAPWFLDTALSLTKSIDDETDAKHTVESMIQRAIGKKIAVT